MPHVYLSLGGNVGSVLFRLKQALDTLAREKDIYFFKSSHFYQTAPIDVNSSNWFVNVVCSFQTSLNPQEIFDMTQRIENVFGKISKPKNASRPIDIDLLFYGDQVYKECDLEIPHPRWQERLFVLVPLNDLVDQLLIRVKKNTQKVYVLKDLIQFLQLQTSQVVYLLEKNPTLQ